MDNTLNTFTITLNQDELDYLNSYNPEEPWNSPPVPKLKEILTNSFVTIQLTKFELFNYFTYDEAFLIAASTNGSTPSMFYSRKKSLINDVSEYYTYNVLDDSINVIQADIISKLDKLTEHQAYCVYQMCFEFWENPQKEQNHEDFKYLERIFQIKQ